MFELTNLSRGDPCRNGEFTSLRRPSRHGLGRTMLETIGVHRLGPVNRDADTCRVFRHLGANNAPLGPRRVQGYMFHKKFGEELHRTGGSTG